MLDPETERFLGQVLDTRGANGLLELVEGYRLCARSEGKSVNTIALVQGSVRYLDGFIHARGGSTNVTEITPELLRHFILDLQQRPRFANHPFTRQQDGQLSGYTINGYLRALRAFWAWLEREELIEDNPFARIKIPRPPVKVIPTFTEEQLLQFFAAIDIATPAGYRDFTIALTLLDTGMRCSELTGLRLDDVNLDGRLLKVWGKGSRERLVPIGSKLQRALWKYITRVRPEPAAPRYDQVFLTRDGRPLTKDRLEAIIERYGVKAGITGVRVSPHTFRHTMAVTFIRSGGDIFSLQRIMGHSSLEVLRTYVNLAQADVSRAHQKHSPADNLEFKWPRSQRQR